MFPSQFICWGLPWWSSAMNHAMQRTWVRYLVKELKFHMLRSNKARILQLLSPQATNGVCVPQQKISHDTTKTQHVK